MGKVFKRKIVVVLLNRHCLPAVETIRRPIPGYQVQVRYIYYAAVHTYLSPAYTLTPCLAIIGVEICKTNLAEIGATLPRVTHNKLLDVSIKWKNLGNICFKATREYENTYQYENKSITIPRCKSGMVLCIAYNFVSRTSFYQGRTRSGSLHLCSKEKSPRHELPVMPPQRVLALPWR